MAEDMTMNSSVETTVDPISDYCGDKMKARTKDAWDFLNALYENVEEGFLSVTCIASGDVPGGNRMTTRWFKPDDLATMAGYIEVQGKKYNTYIGLNPRYKDLGLYKRGGADDVSSLVAAYVDLDIKGPAHKEEDLPETEEEVYDFLNTLPLKPSIVVNSGNGIHAYWIFRDPILLNSPEIRDRARALVKSWEEQILAAAYEQHGWRFDAVADIARMLRAPLTTNFKTEDHEQSRMIVFNSCRYRPEDFMDVLPEGALDILFSDSIYSSYYSGSDADTSDADGEQSGIGQSGPEQDGVDVAGFSRLGKGSGRELIDSCIFLTYCEKHAATLPEPFWHAAISNLALTADGEKLCHEISKPYPNYSYAETERKYRTAVKADKPITCSYIHKRLCFDCEKFRGIPCGVKAPIGKIRDEGVNDAGHDAMDGDNGEEGGEEKGALTSATDKPMTEQPKAEKSAAEKSKALAKSRAKSTGSKSSASPEMHSPAVHSPAAHSPASDIKWETPIPFAERKVPPFPLDALPKPIAAYVSALAEATQTPVDMAASCSIAIMSVALQGKYQVEAKADWIEPVNTYVLIIMPPSERKSAVESAMVKPLTKFEMEENAKKKSLIIQNQSERRILERKQRAIEDQISKGKATQEDLEKISEEIASFKEVTPTRLYVDDITTEKLIQVLAENNGRAAILSTEGGIFDMLSGIYTKTVNIDVMLKGYSGDPIRVERVGRPSDFIPNPLLTVLLMGQPSVLTGIMTNVTFQGRGFTGRFLYCMPVSKVGSRRYRTKPIPPEVYQAYEDRIMNLLQDEYPGYAKYITFSPEADKMMESFSNEVEKQLKSDLSDLTNWAGKLAGNTVRIAGLLCRAERSFDHSPLENQELVVSGETMAKAIKISRYYLAHAKVAFSVLDDTQQMKDAKFVLRMLIKAAEDEKGIGEHNTCEGNVGDNAGDSNAGDSNTGAEKAYEKAGNKGKLSISKVSISKGFSRRDVMMLCRRLKNTDDVQKILDQLVEYGYIAQEPRTFYSGFGRPRTPRYYLNPIVLNDQELKRKLMDNGDGVVAAEETNRTEISGTAREESVS